MARTSTFRVSERDYPAFYNRHKGNIVVSTFNATGYYVTIRHAGVRQAV